MLTPPRGIFRFAASDHDPYRTARPMPTKEFYFYSTSRAAIPLHCVLPRGGGAECASATLARSW